MSLFRRQAAATPAEAGDYAARVVATLATGFPDLQEPHVAEQVEKRISDHVINPDPGLQLIVDSAYVAAWRLTADPDRPGRVRVGCFHDPAPSPADLERDRRINEQVAAL